MKRFLMVIALCVMTFWSSHTLMAGDFGVTGGASFTELKDVSKGLTTGYHAGITYKFHLPLGFAIQPSLLYHLKSSTVDTALQTGAITGFNVGYLELPLSVQWGPDLLLFRPFFDVSPFVGYALNNDIKGYSVKGTAEVLKNKWDGINRLEYGLGIGGGLEIWKIQVVARYNWNFGQLFESRSRAISFNDKNFGGVTLTAALLF